MGDLNIHNKSKSGHIKQEYFLDKALSLGNKSHYRNIEGTKYFPEINLVFPTGNLIYCVDNTSDPANGKLPIIIRSQDTSIDLTNYGLHIEFGYDKNFLIGKSTSGSNLIFHTDLSAYYTQDCYSPLKYCSERSHYIVVFSNSPKDAFEYSLNIYLFLKLVLDSKVGPGLIGNFSVTFKLAQVVNGLLFPDISSFNTFYEEGKFFDGNVYY